MRCPGRPRCAPLRSAGLRRGVASSLPPPPPPSFFLRLRVFALGCLGCPVPPPLSPPLCHPPPKVGRFGVPSLRVRPLSPAAARTLPDAVRAALRGAVRIVPQAGTALGGACPSAALPASSPTPPPLRGARHLPRKDLPGFFFWGGRAQSCGGLCAAGAAAERRWGGVGGAAPRRAALRRLERNRGSICG